MPPPAVNLRHIQLQLGAKPLFDGLSMDLKAGQWTCLLGRSGTGKSTLARMVVGLFPGGPWSGQVTDDQGRSLKGRVTWMAQDDLLFPWLSVIDNVTLGGRLRGESRTSAPAQAQRGREMLARVGLAEAHAAFPATLSGGMRQRAALARTLMEDRPVVVLDEPFAAVDAITRTELQALAFEVLGERTILLITHDPQEAVRLGHQILVLRGSPATLVAPLSLSDHPLRPIGTPTLAQAQRHLTDALESEAGGPEAGGLDAGGLEAGGVEAGGVEISGTELPPERASAPSGYRP